LIESTNYAIVNALFAHSRVESELSSVCPAALARVFCRDGGQFGFVDQLLRIERKDIIKQGSSILPFWPYFTSIHQALTPFCYVLHVKYIPALQ
jgi:hypothetical protein